MIKKQYTLCFFLLFFGLHSHAGLANNGCVSFVSPRQGELIQSQTCTLALNACASVKSVIFKAYYRPIASKPLSPVILGTLTRPPFIQIWNISAIPNQLQHGITCIAEITHFNRTRDTLKLTPVYVAHHTSIVPEMKIPYFNSLNPSSATVSLNSDTEGSMATISTVWNEKSLILNCTMHNPFFYSSLPSISLENFGVYIYLDPENKRSPALSSESLILFLSLTGDISQIVMTTPTQDTSINYSLKQTKLNTPYKCRVIIENFKGYSVEAAIPMNLLHKDQKNRVGCTFSADMIDENSTVKQACWMQKELAVVPLNFGYLLFQTKPFMADLTLQFILFTIIGLIIGLLPIVFFMRAGKRSNSETFDVNEQQNAQVKHINTFLDGEIMNKAVTAESIAQKTNLSLKKIDALLKETFKMDLKNYIIYRRIELVKERLRNSHASEASIAKTCGFDTVQDMESAFKKIVKETPYRYRQEYSIR